VFFHDAAEGARVNALALQEVSADARPTDSRDFSAP